jgi:hypothetical protein
MNRHKIKRLLVPLTFCWICAFAVGCTPSIDRAVNSIEYNLRYAFYNFPYNVRGLYNAFF